MNTSIRPPTTNQNGKEPQDGYLDLSRGARRYHLEPQKLWLAREIWEEYGEVNSALGLNAAGVILSALAGRYAYCPGGMSEGMLTVVLRRQRDDELAEVDMQIHRVEGGANGSYVLLRKLGERLLGKSGWESARLEGRGGGGGGKESEAGRRCRWKFCLQDDPPGPSVGDASEFIEELGMDPWSLEKLELSDQWWEGAMAVSEFEVVGTQKQLEALREAWRRQTRAGNGEDAGE